MTLTLVFGAMTTGMAQKSIIDVQPPAVVIKTAQEKAANSFIAGGASLIISGILGLAVNNMLEKNTANINTIRTMNYVRHGANVVGGAFILNGAVALSKD